ncbi:DUF3592 domain-containing protein [Sphingomonas canadensis]|uniref:DUF3592 domain-containing protein n=1 Tax=Sphingomonas canadensis TaxID=1219257 RepID=A0ABW3HBV1_9SPHN|nr:DUF3592 domain-containing protein [Sphingomonas canadensis]MCW3837931.1 DUF3592 domain-containing protein [Sphingomonas canadensis]
MTSIALIVLAFAGGFFFLHYRGVRKAAEASAWPRAAGVIERCDVTEHSDSSSNDGAVSYSYHVAVTYAYQAGGQARTGKRIHFGPAPSFGSRYKAEAYAARYPAGAAVQVAYDPADPAQSVLETGRVGRTFLWLGILLFAIAIGVSVVGSQLSR